MAQRVTDEFIDRAEAMGDRGCSLEEANDLCRDLTNEHYENFPVLSRLLPEPQRTSLCALYAFARLADDFADEARYQGQRAEMLGLWRERLYEAADGDHAHPIFKSLGHVMDQCSLSPRLLERLLDAFEQDTRVARYETWEELLDYCSRSADPVGRAVLRIFGHEDEVMDRQSDSICTALQLANHWQDVGEDLVRDRIYIPRDVMRQYGVTEAALFERVVTPAHEDMMRDIVRRAWKLFDQGRPLSAKVNRPLRRWIRLVWLGGTTILRKIEQRNFDTLTGRPTLSRADKIALAARGLFIGRLPRSPLW